MNTRTTTAPTVEPLTLAETKVHLREDLTDAGNDALITSLIAVARQACEHRVQRALMLQTLEVTLDAFPSASARNPDAAIELIMPPVIDVTSVTYTAANGWVLWNHYRDVPAQRMEVKLESGMYSWDYTYANGVQSQNELRVPVGKPVLLRMTSRDTLHSHYMPVFRVKEDSMPGRVTYIWFLPKAAGEHVVTCAEYCGVEHSYMAGKIIAMPPAEFNAWLDKEAAKLAQAGKPAA